MLVTLDVSHLLKSPLKFGVDANMFDILVTFEVIHLPKSPSKVEYLNISSMSSTFDVTCLNEFIAQKE